MAKRFTDTDKWKRPWFCDLPVLAKISWLYVVDDCDFCGIWNANFRRMSFDIGAPVSREQFETWMEKKFVKVEEDRYFFRSFIEFQYGTLRDNNSVHLAVVNNLRQYGIAIEVASGLSDDPAAVLKRLSQKRRLEIFAEDSFRCTYCGLPGEEPTLRVDHILARSFGGGNAPENLTTACLNCNSRKSDLSVFEFIRRHRMEASLSERLRAKLALMQNAPDKPLNAPFNSLNGAKDKEKDKEMYSPPGARTKKVEISEIERCSSAWKQSLKAMGHERNLLAEEERLIFLALKNETAEMVEQALLGAAHEPKIRDFNPQRAPDISRILGDRMANKPPQIAKFVGYANTAAPAEPEKKTLADLERDG